MKKKTVLGLVLVFVLLMGVARVPPFAILRVWCYGTPDSYGNRVLWHTVEQHNGTDWELLHNHTTASVGNFSVRVYPDTPTRFIIRWRLNETLTDDNSTARDETRINMNITDGGTIWSMEELNATGIVSSDANYYYGLELGLWNWTGYPVAGVTYDVETAYYGNI